MTNPQGEAIAEFDCFVVGGGPAGATAATDLVRAGRSVLLLDRAGRIKPCGGAIPPRAIADFAIPDHLLVAKATLARMVAPSGKAVDMPVGNGFVGLVDREVFDEWLRARAALAGAERRTGTFERIERDAAGAATVVFREERGGTEQRVRARSVIGADGARSGVARAELKGAGKVPCVFAYHEIIASPKSGTEHALAGGGADAAERATRSVSTVDFAPARCDVFYQGKHSPDFYAWVFPHGETASIGVGSAKKGFALRDAVAALRAQTGSTLR